MQAVLILVSLSILAIGIGFTARSEEGQVFLFVIWIICIFGMLGILAFIGDKRDRLQDALIDGKQGEPQKTNIWIIFLMLFFFGYGLMNNAWGGIIYSPSSEWHEVGSALSMIIAAIIVSWNIQGWRSDRLRPRPGKKKPNFFTLIFSLPIYAALLFVAIIYGVGSVTNNIIGETGRQTFQIEKTDHSFETAIHVKHLEDITFGKFFLNPEDFSALSKNDTLDFEIKKSWFGITLNGYFKK